MRWQSGVTRRTVLGNAAAGTAALAAGAIGAYAQPASKPPNIVFILADIMRPARLVRFAPESDSPPIIRSPRRPRTTDSPETPARAALRLFD